MFGVHDTGPILNFLPIILVGILFGLAMDYLLFLTSGMREAYVHGAPARHGRRAGLPRRRVRRHRGRDHHGLGLRRVHLLRERDHPADRFRARRSASSLDAFVVRMFIVPALMHLAGDWAWWLPKWLDRLIPNVDVEGASLERRHPHVASEHTASEGGAIEPAASVAGPSSRGSGVTTDET